MGAMGWIRMAKKVLLKRVGLRIRSYDLFARSAYCGSPRGATSQRKKVKRVEFNGHLVAESTRTSESRSTNLSLQSMGTKRLNQRPLRRSGTVCRPIDIGRC